MHLQHSIGDPYELAALYLSGAMAEPDSAAFELHLDAGCPVCRSAFAELGPAMRAISLDAPPLDPPAEVRSALLSRIAQDASEPSVNAVQVWRGWLEKHSDAGLFIVRHDDESGWEDTGVPGVRVRRLSVDETNGTFTAMVRMAPGSSYPIHIHHGSEECLVLEGDLRVGNEELGRGDYQLAPVGTLHGVQSTRGGCVLLIRSSLHDELVDGA